MYEIHPIALAYPEMPQRDFAAFLADVAQNGIVEPIILFEGKVLDGRHRLKAWSALREGHPISLPVKEFEGDEPDARRLADSLNVHRRHLSAEEKRAAIAFHLTLDPEKSDRQVATMVKASPTTVGKVRQELEAAGDVSIVDTRTDSKGRRQPSSKPKHDERTDAVQSFFDSEGETVVPDPQEVAAQKEDVWRGRVLRNLKNAHELVLEALRWIPSETVFKTEALCAQLDVALPMLDNAVTMLQVLPRGAFESEAEAVEFLQEGEEELQVETCFICGNEIAPDLLGEPIVTEYGRDAYLRSGIVARRGLMGGDPTVFHCAACARIQELGGAVNAGVPSFYKLKQGQQVRVTRGVRKDECGVTCENFNFGWMVRFSDEGSLWIAEAALEALEDAKEQDEEDAPSVRVCASCGVSEARFGLYCELCDPAADISPVGTTSGWM